MPDGETHATGPPERRTRVDMDAFERRMMAAIKEGDEATVASLTKQMDERQAHAKTEQEAVLSRLSTQDAALDSQTTTLTSIEAKLDSQAEKLDQHAEFVRAKQEQDAELLRVTNEQSLKAKLLAEIAKAEDDKRAARRARRNRVFPLISTMLAGLGGGTLLYAFDNINHLLPEQVEAIAVIMVLLTAIAVVLYRNGP